MMLLGLDVGAKTPASSLCRVLTDHEDRKSPIFARHFGVPNHHQNARFECRRRWLAMAAETTSFVIGVSGFRRTKAF